MGTIVNGKNTPINVKTGTVPDVSGAMHDWFQPMTFSQVIKTTEAFRVVETENRIAFRGVIQPLSGRRLAMKPEGQRVWTWLLLHADISLRLDVDEVVSYLDVQTRIMSQKDFSLYGYMEYELVQDWTGAGPEIAVAILACENGDELQTESGNYLVA